MNKTSIIAYSSNFFSQDQKPICYFLFQSMLAREGNEQLQWFASIHPRDDEDGVRDAAERLALCVQGRLQANERVLVVGGDLSGLGCLAEPVGVLGTEPAELETFWSDYLAAYLPTVVFTSTPEAARVGVLMPNYRQMLPRAWQVVYVPELCASEDMAWLMQEVQRW